YNNKWNSKVYNQWFTDGYLCCETINLESCDNVEFQVLSDTALISGKVSACCEAGIHHYVKEGDKAEWDYNIICKKYIGIDVYFHFVLKHDESCLDFETTDVLITSID
ncbi:MAG: hypothetical protein WCH76_08060, partial [Candidatus Riflemargulisbacteria bacterium]